MATVRLVGLLVYTLGAFAFGAMLVVWLRELGRVGWTGSAGTRRHRGEVELVGGALIFVSFTWFLVNVLLGILQFGPPVGAAPLRLLSLWLALTFPPLIMHVTFVEVAEGRARAGKPPPGRGWRGGLWGMYAVTQGLAAWAILALTARAIAPGHLLDAALNYGVGLAFVGAAAYSIALMSWHRPPQATPRERQSHRWALALFASMVPLFALIILLIRVDAERWMPALSALVDVAARSLPLMFIFVGTYHENRFEFFDIFVKRGLWLLLTIALLAGAFAVALPVLRPFHASWAAPWLYTLFLLPIVLLLPWLQDRIARALDRRWLGRRFGTVDAVKRFLNGLRSATTEAQLVEQAELGFSDIFGAAARVQLGAAGTPPPFDVVQEVAILPGDPQAGRILLGARGSEAPYFGKDLALAASLADVFASLLDNLRLQEHRRQQEQRAREMALQASRSELKALRAQINPHFFFNALNAIAGLIHRDPAVADRTIEQLAEVFRYALRGSLDEWARVEDELEFVRAYLAIEQARFGPRLQVDVRCSPEAAGARIPTLAIQTLVENALKHGVGEVLGTGIVEVDARLEADRLLVSVVDNGPGFDPGKPPAPGGGYGLSNVRRRLDGYFGHAASLETARDTRQGRTVVTLTLPHQPSPAREAGTFAERGR